MKGSAKAKASAKSAASSSNSKGTKGQDAVSKDAMKNALKMFAKV